MKKIINSSVDFVDEMLDGLCSAHPEYYAQPERRVLVRSVPARDGKVGIVTGGGSGHLPIFAGYVGPGLLDGAAIGDVFASPSSDQIRKAIKHAERGAGVLCLYGNYGGDVMNFDMACEMLELEGLRTETVLVADDVASAPLAEAAKRRGVAGMVYAFKIAGAAADAGGDLTAVTAAARKAAESCRSIGVALSPCIVPQAGKPSFTLGEDEIEMGMGIHGERGIWRNRLRSADEIVDEMVARLREDMPLASGQRVSVLVNSLGATPPEELYVAFRRVRQILEADGIRIVMPLVGRYATSMEMAGMSLTVMALDDELEAWLKAPAACAFWQVAGDRA